MIQTAKGRHYVTRAKQHRAKFFCNVITPHNTCNAITPLPKTRKYLCISSYIRDFVIWVKYLCPKHPSHSSYPDREASPIGKTGIDPLSRVYNGRRSE